MLQRKMVNLYICNNSNPGAVPIAIGMVDAFGNDLIVNTQVAKLVDAPA